MTIDERIESLRDIIKVQCSNGNWNYDPYMHGLANGMLMAISFFDDRAPIFLEAPDEWLCDKPQTDEAPISVSCK